jgi:hypothetical protein
MQLVATGIAGYIVDALVQRTLKLGEGRGAGCIGFTNDEGIIDTISPIVDGGIAGLPLRMLLSRLVPMKGRCTLEGLEALPANSVLILTRPGRTGLITDVGGIDFFNIPIVAIGVKEGKEVGVGVIHPEKRHFDLATESEQLDLATLKAMTVAEEREVLRRSNQLGFEFLELSQELPVVDVPEQPPVEHNADARWTLPRFEVGSLDKGLAGQLVEKSLEVGQGREVAAIGEVGEDGKVRSAGKPVAGGMGYVPSRLLASSVVKVDGKPLREIYAAMVSPRAVVVHTHPGGSGVMHIGDAQAVPGTWGRPIIAIGHDKDGTIRGATVLTAMEKLFDLADEDERLGQKFFEARTPEAETEVRNRKFGIAQEYTNLCKPIEIQ